MIVKRMFCVHDLVALVDEILVQQRHQEVEFGLRPLPVLAAEAVERELAEAEPAAFFDGGADALHAAGVALDARQAAFLGPAAVAVHDDGDVLRHLGRVEAGGPKPLQRFGICFTARQRIPLPGATIVIRLDFCISPGRCEKNFRCMKPMKPTESHAKIVCSRSGPTDTTPIGRSSKSPMRSRYFRAAAGRSASFRAPDTSALQPGRVS